MFNSYNAKQLARIEDRLARFQAGKISFFALVADLKFFTSALQEPIGPLSDALTRGVGLLDALHKGLILDEEGGYREMTSDENESLKSEVLELSKALLAGKTET